MALSAARRDADHRCGLLIEHDPFGKPAPTFPDHALSLLLGAALELLFERGELCKRRIGIDRPFARRPRCEVPLTPLVAALVTMTIMTVATAVFVAVASLLVGRLG
jgi:hypothetical protein